MGTLVMETMVGLKIISDFNVSPFSPDDEQSRKTLSDSGKVN